MINIVVIAAAIFSFVSPEHKFLVKPTDDLASTVEQAVDYSNTHPGKKVAVILSDGTYTLKAPITLSRIGGAFRIAAADKAHPLINGDTDIKGWKPSNMGKGIVEAVIPEDIHLGVPVGDTCRIDFYVDGKRQELARWPNGIVFTYAGKCLDPNEKNGYGSESSDVGVLEYKDERIARWSKEKDPRLLGYWKMDWYETFKKLVSVDVRRHSFTVNPINDTYGYRAGCRFYGFNLLCELDAMGEYYIDRETRKIYWVAPEGFLKNPTSTRISVFDRAMITAESCSDLTIEGLELRGGRGAGIVIKEGSSCCVKDCHIHCFAENALNIIGGRSNSVKDCVLEQLGKTGMHISGGNRRTLESADMEISGCRVHDFALYKHTYCPAVYFGGVGAHIHHCDMYNSTSSAMRLEGNDILVEHNTLHDLVRESDDQGAIESWGNMSYRRMIVRYNHFSDINGGTLCGSAAVRFDDLISGNEVYSNTFERCGSLLFGAVQIHGGRDNKIHHNTFIDCHSTISHSAWSWDSYKKKVPEFSRLWKGIDMNGKLYQSRYPELRTPADSLNHNRNYFYGNRSIRCGEPMRANHIVMKGNKSEGVSHPSLQRRGTMKLDKEALEAGITASQKARIDNGMMTGAQVIVYQDGQMVLDKCFGTKTVGGRELDGNEIYRVASMTKPITAFALLLEQDRGHLNINDDLGTYLPEFSGRNIKLGQLVSHISGVPDVSPGDDRIKQFTLDSAVAYLKNKPLDFEPSTMTRYSTGAFDLVAKVIEKVTGKRYESYLKENLFDKLGMNDTRFVPSSEQWGRFVGIHGRDSLGHAVNVPQEEGCVFVNYPLSYPMAGAGLMSTAADYMKFACMLLNHGKSASGESIINWNTLEKMSKVVVDDKLMPGSQKWGLGVRTIVDGDYILPKGSYGWSGYYGTHFWVDPENNLAVVYMKNSTYDGGAGCQTANELEKDVMKALRPR